MTKIHLPVSVRLPSLSISLRLPMSLRIPISSRELGDCARKSHQLISLIILVVEWLFRISKSTTRREVYTLRQLEYRFPGDVSRSRHWILVESQKLEAMENAPSTRICFLEPSPINYLKLGPSVGVDACDSRHRFDKQAFMPEALRKSHMHKPSFR